MSDELKKNGASSESGAPITPGNNKDQGDNGQNATIQQDRDYQKLVEKSLEEQITDTQISRADITNPNLHYGTDEDLEHIAPHIPVDEEQSTPHISESRIDEHPEEQKQTEEKANETPATRYFSTNPPKTPGSGPESPPPVTETPPPTESPEPPITETPTPKPDPKDTPPDPDPNPGGDPTPTYDPDLVSTGDEIDENAAEGTVVATLDLTGAAGTTYSYAITDADGNPVTDANFVIVGNEIVVAPFANIDYESNPSHSFFVTGRDNAGNAVTEQITITVNDVNEFDVSAITDTDATDNTVSEAAAIGDSVGITAFASDADGTNNGVTYSLSDDAGGLFAIDPNTGEVTVAAPLDYETATSHNIEVTATSEDGSTSTQNFSINVSDQDEFDVSAITDTDATDNTVSEAAAIGDSVGITAFASDADGTNNGVTYSLSDDAGGLFAIDPNTGEVTVAAPLDYETATSHNIEVTATSEDGSTSTQNFSINVSDQDEFDVSAITDTDATDNTVSEAAAIGDSVGITAFASDADGTNNGVTYSLSDDAGGLFAIDPNTGEVTVAAPLDYETATSHNIEVTATSEDGSTSTQNFSINVSDQDEFDVSAITDTDATDNTVSEAAAIGDSVGITAFASDADGTNNGVTYSLSDDAGGLFAIDPNTGEVTVAAPLDYETATSHNIEVTATSEDGSTSTQNFSINVSDQDEFDVSAITDTDATDNTVSEAAAIGDSVGITAFASDVDGTNNGVTYSLSDDAGGLFAIDPNTGEVTVAAPLDYETATSHNIEVTATSEDGSTSTQNFSINVSDQDEFDVSAITDADATDNTVSEAAAIGDSVGITAFASDADGTNNGVTYSLSDDAGGLFAIDPNTGEVTVAAPLDYETATSHNIEVTATSEDGSTSTQNFSINVSDQDEFDVSAITDTDATDNTVSEAAAIGDSVGITAFASDADGTNNGVTYSLSDDAGGLFAIDPNTGEVTVAAPLDYETATSHNIEVTATSEDGSTSTQNFSINVSDQDEFDVSAITDTDATDNTVSEAAAIGDSVGITAFASDADGTNNGVTYSLSDDAGGLFAIDPNTGEVTVAAPLDYETATSHNIEVTATSEDGSTSTQNFSINVSDQDEFDVSAITDTDATDNTVSEAAAIGDSVGITAFASDADGTNNGVTYSLSDDAGGLFAIDPNTGEVTVAAPLDYETATSHNIEVTATSEDGSTSTQNFSINVSDQDEFDVSAITDTDATDNTVSEAAAIGDSVGITAFASDADGTNNGVTYSLSDDAGGLFAIDPNTGEVTVAAPLDYETATSHNIEVTATSEDGSTSTQNFSINVSDQDEFDVSAITDTDATDNTVSEAAAIGDSVGITAFASDADGTNNGVTYSLSDDAGGLFAIDPNTGEVTVAAPLDYETATSHNIEVTATSEDGSTSTQNFSINVSDQDEFDVSAITDTDATDNTVSEAAAIGDSVGITAFASDADGTNNGVTYSLSDDAGGLFAIDPNTGEVTVAAPLDYETATSHNIEVTATSEDGSTSTQNFSINVSDQDEFDVSAITDTDATDNTVSEAAAIGDSVGITAFASDADGTNNGVTYSLSDDAGGLFAIDPNTGEVTVAAPLDYETATSHNIEVTATSEDGSTSTQNFSINVSDQDEFDVSAITDTDATDNTVSEAAAIGDSVGITAFASDADGTNNGVTYSLSDDAGGLFAIDPNTGEVTVAAPLDYETATSHNIEVTATSEDGSTSTQNFSINVSDQDEFDVSAITDTDATDNTVSEAAAIGDSVGITAFASDADGTNNGVTYSLSDDAGGLFAIDPNTGEVTVAAPLDYETATSHNIEVTATSEDGSTSTQNFSINVSDQDEFDVSAITDTDATDNTVSEAAAIGDSVGITAFASDADGTNNGVTYSLSDDAGGLFAIDPNTGEVTVAAPLDYETATSHNIEVTATSEDGSTSTQNFSINVSDQDEFDVSAITDTDATDNTVSEAAAIGDSVGITAFASDADGTNNGVTYSLSDDAGGLFAIDPNTGEVTVAAPLDYETATSHNIEVTATSEDGSTSTQNFSINVSDQDEFDVSAITDTDATDNTVSEAAAIGDSVGITAFASDADGTNNGVTYSLSDDAGGLFAIDPNTGEVTVAAPLDYETATSHNIEVTATSEDGSTSTQNFSINVSDQDEFDVSAITDTDATDNTVSEAAAIGDSVGITAFASDADGTNNGVTYSLSDDAGGLFAIDPNTGEVTVAAPLDYETATSHNIEVTATSEDGSTSTQNFSINVSDQDEFDVSAITDTDATDNTVSEAAAIGDSVGITAFASDADGTNNGVTYSLSDDAGGLFAIDPNTGEVTVAAPLDYETATSHNIEVTATSEDGSTSTQNFSINVSDQDEFDVSAITDTDATDNTVSEAAAIGDSVGITAFASDADGTNNGVTYSLSDDAGGLFAIDPNTGEVTVAAPLDYETATSHNIEVTATSEDGSTSTQNFSINVSDQNEGPTDLTLTGGSVAENSFEGVVVGTVAATDPDAGETFTYSLTDDAGGRFDIDPSTGEITVADRIDTSILFDTEVDPTHDIIVEVTDSAGNTYHETMTINVTDIVNETIQGDEADNNLTGAIGNDTIFDTSGGNDILSGGEGNDILYDIGGGDDTLLGGEGDDLMLGGTGADTIDGGEGNDTAYYSTSSEGVNIALGEGENAATVSGGDATGDTITNVENLFGSTKDDTLTGNSENNTLSGYTGDDTISGGTGDDTLYGDYANAPANNGGNDTITGGAGNDTIDGNGGNDTAIYSGKWSDYTITENDGVFTLIDNRPGSPDGTDTVTNVENFQFADGTVPEVELLNVGPTDISPDNANIDENSAAGTVVATLTTTDSNDLDSHTYEITNDPSGNFEIVGNEVRVKSGADIDYETATAHKITIEVTDTGGNTYSETVEINVNDLNEAPDAQDVKMGATNEDTSYTITEKQLLSNSSDPDAGSNLEVTALSLDDNSHGTLTDNGDGTWTFTPTDDLAIDDVNFSFTISDGTHTDSAVATLDVTAVADEPTLTLSTTTQEVISSNDSLESGFEGDVAAIGATGNNGFVGSIGGWRTDSDAIEVKTETLADGSTNQFIELNDDRLDFYEDATNIYQEINTTDGGTYTVDFNFAPRPGYDSSVNTIEVLVDGVVVETISADGTGDSAINWQSQSVTFEGDGTPMRVEFREAGTDLNYGRGMYMDNISITEELPEGVIHGDENTAIALPDFTASTNDSDGSETLSLTISNLPEGATLSDGTNTFTASAGESIAEVTDWQLDSITITPPSEYSGEMDITVNATSTDGTDQNTVSENITVIVDDDDDTFTGTATEDLYDGGAGDDIINGNGGNDWLSGGEGNDALNGGTGDDILSGGAGDDRLAGEDGNDLFIFQMGDGHDSISGGAGGSWTDTIMLQDENGGSDIGTFGEDWTLTLDSGSIDSINEDSIDLSDDADGSINLSDGSSIDFADIERIDW